MEQTSLEIKNWDELTSEELQLLNESHNREWQSAPMGKEYHSRNIFFLLKNDKQEIVAQGQLIPIEGIKFMDQSFSIYGIGGIIANVKGKGYGRQIMSIIRDYLIQHHKTGVGFTGVPGFYERCGYLTNGEAVKRFVYVDDNKHIVNTECTHICYLDSHDKFVEKVLEYPKEKVYLPRNPNW